MKGQLLLQNCISLSILSFLNALLFPCTLRAFSSLPVSFTLIKRNIRVTVPAKGPLGHQQPLLIFPCLLLTPRHGPGPHFSPCPACGWCLPSPAAPSSSEHSLCAIVLLWFVVFAHLSCRKDGLPDGGDIGKFPWRSWTMGYHNVIPLHQWWEKHQPLSSQSPLSEEFLPNI